MHTPVTAFLSNPHARRYLLARHLSLYLLAGERGKEKKKRDLDGRFVIETLFSAAATGLINIQIVSIIPSAHRFPDDCRGKILSYHVSQRRIAQQSLQAYQRPPSLCVCVSLSTNNRRL